MAEYPEFLDDVLSRFKSGWPRQISCDTGWYPLIERLHGKIVAIDPSYELLQVKEKFGGLRYYYMPSDPKFAPEIDEEIRKAERISFLTCEITGKPGEPMKRHGQIKTLHRSFVSKGWKPLGDTSE